MFKFISNQKTPLQTRVMWHQVLETGQSRRIVFSEFIHMSIVWIFCWIHYHHQAMCIEPNDGDVTWNNKRKDSYKLLKATNTPVAPVNSSWRLDKIVMRLINNHLQIEGWGWRYVNLHQFKHVNLHALCDVRGPLWVEKTWCFDLSCVHLFGHIMSWRQSGFILHCCHLRTDRSGGAVRLLL